MNVLAITQARLGSSRLPGKVLKKVNDQTLLEIHLKRILKSKKIDKLLVATTINKEDDKIAEVVAKMNLSFYRGSVNNVLERFYKAAKQYNPEWIVRVTSDCPLVDAAIVDAVIDKTISENLDYCSNTLEPTFPNGMDVEVFKMKALEKALLGANLDSDKEHVTPYIHRNSSFYNKAEFVSDNFSHQENFAEVRLTVDEMADFEVIQALVEKLGIESDWKTYTDYYLSHKEIRTLNEHIERNEGYIKSLNDDRKNNYKV